MVKSKNQGKFFVFEGIDGSGHTTALELVFDNLQRQGFSVVKTKEPTEDTESGLIARRILKSGEKYEPDDLQKLFRMDRAVHVLEIRRFLIEGVIVLCDRFIFSNIAYGEAEGLSRKYLIEQNSRFLKPAITFLIDAPAEVAIERISARGNEIERFEKLETLKKVRTNFLSLARFFQEQIEIVVIDGTFTREEVAGRILPYIESFLKTGVS